MTEPSYFADLQHRAEAHLPWYVAEYFAATAGSREGRDAALAEWDALRFRPLALRGAQDLSLATSILGTEVTTPLLIAPMAQQVAAHPRGEQETAEAAGRIGTLLGVSTNTAVPFADIAAAGAPWWFQVYLLADRGVTEALVRRAVDAGAGAIILTIDTTALLVSAPGVEPTEWPEGRARERLSNLTDAELRVLLEAGPPAPPTLDDIRWLAAISGLPIVVKGVLRGDDAAAVVEAGAAGVIVSTHGGRRMPQSVSALAALPEVVAAVDGAAEVYVDSGIRSGAHALAALALGARAVFVGRPVMYALAAGGAAEVEATLRRLDGELRLALQQSGATSLAALPRDLVALP